MKSQSSFVIVYLRRSTDNGQKHSIEAQLEFITQFCREHDLHIFQTYIETHTGSTMNRPILQEALDLSQRKNYPIIIRSISRLGRDASEVINMINSERIIVADQGLECDSLTLNLLAVLNQNERERLSIRTKEALQAAKSKGITLGNPKLAEARIKGLEQNIKNADAFAYSMSELFKQNAHLSYREQAKRLNKWRVPSRRGGKWSPQSVKNLHIRLERMNKQSD